MSTSDNDERLANEVTEGIRSLRERERRDASTASEIPGPPRVETEAARRPLGAVAIPDPSAADAPLGSPDRDTLNAVWNVAEAMEAAGSKGPLGPVRRMLQKVARFALGPVVERQVQMNSAQVQFDNEVVRYLDERLDRMSRHYDAILGLHGKRMQEIDERHLILQQELIRHVHDLVERIEFVFESAEQNHLYLEGMLRETKEDLSRLLERWERPPEAK